MGLRKCAAIAAAIAVTGAMPAPVFAASIREKTEEAKDMIPTCTHRIGALAVREPDNKWWQGLGLESPEALLKVMVQRSGCFTLVDRGRGFELAQQERALAAGGALQGGANIGNGQLVAADYIMVPDITSKNANSGGTAIGGLLGGGGFGGGVFGGAGVSNYANTAIGQVVTLAYIDAYSKLVEQMGGLSDAPAQTAPAQAVTLSLPGVMRSAADETAPPVRSLSPGMILYPTGQTNGVWVEVQDEVGNKGWVSRVALSNSR